VSRQTLWNLLSGRQKNPKLASRYFALKAAQEGAKDGAHNTVAAGRDARQRVFCENQKSVFRKERTADLAAIQNHLEEYQAILEKLGLQILVLRFDGDAASPVWKEPALGESLGAELDACGAGSFDSSHLAFGSFFCYFHVAHLAKSLGALKNSLQSRGLLDNVRIFHIEIESGWREYFPATGQIFSPADSD
jgi:hypothetical protein